MIFVGLVKIFGEEKDSSYIISLIIVISLIVLYKLYAKSTQKQKFEKTGIILELKLKHINGLPITEDTVCHLKVYENKYEITGDGYDFNLSREKIQNVSIKTHTEIQNQAVSSIGGAIAGAVLFGPLGGIIGGRVKTHKTETNTKYLIITYTKGKTIKNICFEANEESVLLVKEFSKDKKPETIKRKKIEL